MMTVRFAIHHIPQILYVNKIELQLLGIVRTHFYFSMFIPLCGTKYTHGIVYAQGSTQPLGDNNFISHIVISNARIQFTFFFVPFNRHLNIRFCLTLLFLPFYS